MGQVKSQKVNQPHMGWVWGTDHIEVQTSLKVGQGGKWEQSELGVQEARAHPVGEVAQGPLFLSPEKKSPICPNLTVVSVF